MPQLRGGRTEPAAGASEAGAAPLSERIKPGSSKADTSPVMPGKRTEYGSMDASSRGPNSPTAVMQRIADEAVGLIARAEGAALEFPCDDHLVYVCGSGSLSSAVGTKVERRFGLPGRALDSLAILHCEDVYKDPRADLEASVALGLRSTVCVPLHDHGTALGVLEVGSSAPGAFTKEDVALLTGLADFVSATISLAAAAAISGDQADERVPGDGSPASARASQMARFIANVTWPGLANDIEADRRIRAVMDNHDYSPLFQPVVLLESGELTGVEALTRFHAVPYRSPDLWFAEAHRVGLGVELELAAAWRALALLPELPASVRLALNFGPDAIGDPRLMELIASSDPDRLVIELTEHDAIESYPRLRASIMNLRQTGVKFALDDVGTGFSNLAHIINFAPDIIKLDIELVRGIDIDPVRGSLSRAMVNLAQETGAEVVAEGVEREEEREALLGVGVRMGQGFLFGRRSTADALGKTTRMDGPGRGGELPRGARRP